MSIERREYTKNKRNINKIGIKEERKIIRLKPKYSSCTYINFKNYIYLYSILVYYDKKVHHE
jgi:hypothetical protein